jgi:glycosyltransferase involved in cell wall biosynthesis
MIAETLDSIVGQLQDDVELVILDGGSPDNTEEVVAPYVRQYSNVRYVREDTNSGVDEDYDKAVGYARGRYCWLMPDDDLMRPGAIARVLDAIKQDHELILVEAEVRTRDFSEVLERSRTGIAKDRRYGPGDAEQLFTDMCDHLSFIGAVIIRRDVWQQRDRQAFFGSLFIHVGVIFQTPAIESALFIAEPQIIIRYGNANWTSRTFEIWMFKWPGLVHGFADFSTSAKAAVVNPYPWRNMMQLLKHRAERQYSLREFGLFLRHCGRVRDRCMSLFVGLTPASLANFVAVLYVVTLKRNSRLGLYDLLDSKAASWASHFLARTFPLADGDDMYTGPK